MRQQTLNIRDEADRLREDIADLEAEIESAVDEAMALDPPADEDEEAELRRVQEEYDDMEASRVTLQGYVDILDEHADEWDGAEIVLQELSGAQARMVRDEANRDAEDHGFTSAPSGFMEVRMAQSFVVSTPPGAPDPQDIGQLPDRLFSWLYGRGNALNTVGDMDMGNLSLRERMADRRG